MSTQLGIREAVKRGITRIIVSDDKKEVHFIRFRKGIFFVGTQKIINAVNRNKSSLQTMCLTDSALNVVIAVSENEGNLDAINIWDNSFMTFGIFHWAVGLGKRAITSEYGVGLILGNHVNRPGYVKPCLEKVLNEANLPEPSLWTTEEEMELSNGYLPIRVKYGKYPMTDANKRAEVTKKYLENGTISSQQDSFQYDIQE